MATAVAAASDGREASGRWLFGPGPDLLLGCGGAYALVFVALVAAGDLFRGLLPYGFLPLLVLVTSIPHYGGTLLRVYDRSEDRRAYRVFTVWATLAVAAWFLVGVYEVAVGTWLVTLYLTWSPWHYSGQNYGIALMFLRRRGVAVDPTAKRLFYASFLLSYAIAFLGSHAASQTATYAPGSLEGVTYRFLRLGVPMEVAGPLLAVAVVAYAGATLGATLRLRRAGGWSDLAPALVIVAIQGVWFSLPVLARTTGILDDLTPFDTSVAQYTFLWIAMAHAVQYLWVTTYFAARQDRGLRRGPYYARTLLAGSAVWGVPLLLFGPDLLGVRGHDAGHALLVAAAVNVHHFVLDGAIWKLRDGRIARVLIRPAEAPGVRPIGPDRGAGMRWVRWSVAVAGIVYILTTVLATFEFELGVRRATDPPDFERLAVAAERLRWLGRDHPDVHHNLAVHAIRQGDLDRARRELERSLALRRSAPAYATLGIVESRAGDAEAALDAYDAALAIDPRYVPALVQSAGLLEARGDTARARERLERALAQAPGRLDLAERLDALDPSPP